MGVERIERNLTQVREEIAQSCERSGRNPSEVTLIAVTKTVGEAEVAELARLGVRDFGENRVPAGPQKAAAFAGLGYNWHFIGHLQRNKADKALKEFRIIHSLESAALAEVLQKESLKHNLGRIRVLLEVNTGGEENKYGVAAEEAEALARQIGAQSELELCGLMTMAPLDASGEDARPFFRNLRQLRDVLRDATGLALPWLSMGMSGDFPVAVEEGATHVRVGTALFI